MKKMKTARKHGGRGALNLSDSTSQSTLNFDEASFLNGISGIELENLKQISDLDSLLTTIEVKLDRLYLDLEDLIGKSNGPESAINEKQAQNTRRKMEIDFLVDEIKLTQRTILNS